METALNSVRKTISVLTGVILGGLFVSAVYFSVQGFILQGEIEEVRKGEVYTESIKMDKLATDVFTTVFLEVEGGTQIQAKILEAEVNQGNFLGDVVLQTIDGDEINATVISEGGNLIVSDDGQRYVARIGESEIQAEHLSEDSVNTAQLVDGSITSGKLADGVISVSHLEGDIISMLHIQDGSVTAVKLAGDSVNSSKVVDGSLTNADLALDASIDWSKINKTGASLGDIADVNAVDVDVADLGGYFTASDLENVVAEIGSGVTLDSRYVNASGDTMIGPLVLPSNGLSVGTTELVVAGGKVGIGTDSPDESLHVVGNRMIIEDSGSTSYGTIEFGSDSGNRYLRLNASEMQIGPTITNVRMMNAVSSNKFQSSTADGITAWQFESRTQHTSANLFEILNAGTSLFTVDYAGSTLIDLTADTVGLTIQANSTQTENLFEWQKSDGTVVGGLQLGTSNALNRFWIGRAAPFSPVDVAGFFGGITRMVPRGDNVTLLNNENFAFTMSNGGLNYSLLTAINVNEVFFGTNQTKPFSLGTNNAKILSIGGSGGVTIDGVSDTQQLIVQANSTQTSNILEIQDSSAVMLLNVTDGGVLNLPVTTSSSGRITQIYNGSPENLIHTYRGAGSTSFPNLFIGKGSGNFTMNSSGPTYEGTGNIGMGLSTGASLTTGFYNIMLGSYSGLYISSGSSNFLAGHQAGNALNTGSGNFLMGRDTGLSLTSGANNIAIGGSAMRFNVSGSSNVAIGENSGRGVDGNSYQRNTFIGAQSGYGMTTGTDNIIIGYRSGYRQATNSNLFIVDNVARADVATELTDSILYGVMSPTKTSQSLRINASTLISDALSIEGSSDEVQLIVKANATQTSHLMTFLQGDSTVIGYMTNTGKFSARHLDAASTGTVNLTLTRTDSLIASGQLAFRGSDGVADWAIGTNVAAGSGKLEFNEGVTPRMVIIPGGNVGIGTDSPSEELHIEASSTATGLIKSTAGSATMVLMGGTGLNAYYQMGDGSTIESEFFWDGVNSAFKIRTKSTDSLALGVNGGVNLLIQGSTGYVGIGEISPGSELDIVGKVRLTSSVTDATNKYGYNLSRHYTNTEEDFLNMIGSSTATDNFITLGGSSSVYNAATAVRFYTAANTATLTGTERMRIDNNGDVGINDTTPSYKLDVNGTLRAFGITDSSDVRLKNTITNLRGSLDKIKQLRGVNYMWNNADYGTSLQMGLIAQEVEGVVPEVVSTDGDGYKSIAYGKLSALIIEGIKEQQTQIEDLQAQIDNLVIPASQAFVLPDTYDSLVVMQTGETYGDGLLSYGTNGINNVNLLSSAGIGVLQSKSVLGWSSFAINPEGGNVGINNYDPTVSLDINGDSIRIRTPKTPVEGEACDAGEIAWDVDALYVCVDTNVWKKSVLEELDPPPPAP